MTNFYLIFFPFFLQVIPLIEDRLELSLSQYRETNSAAKANNALTFAIKTLESFPEIQVNSAQLMSLIDARFLSRLTSKGKRGKYFAKKVKFFSGNHVKSEKN